MVDESERPSAVGLRRGRREAETTGDVTGMTGIQVGMLLLLLFLNLLAIWVLWSVISAL
jgi:hypothetical protein